MSERSSLARMPARIRLLTRADPRCAVLLAVPDVVSERLFWSRYLFRVSLLEQEEER